jgi:sugar lactone lactonase YvrE
MKYILTGLCVLAALSLHLGCARSNVFDEPPGNPVIDSLVPASGTIGTQVRLYGSGFSTTLSQDTVNINGVRVRVDASTSTVLLVTVIDSTGTGHVNVKVNGQSAQGPIFTYKGNGNPTGNAPVIIGGGFGWSDESGYWVTMKSLPADDNSIRLFIGGVEIPIAFVIREGSPQYDPVQGYRLLVYNEDVVKNAVDIYANFQATYSGVPGNVYPYQLKPVVTGIVSRRGDYAFAVGDTVTITGKYFGAPTIPSFVSLRWNGQQLPNPAILSWTNTEIRAVMPAYPQVLIDAAIPLSIQVGQIESSALGCRYLGTISGTMYLVAGSDQGANNGYGSTAQFNGPAGVALDALGNLYVADQYNNRIRKISNITTAGGAVTTLAGSIAGFRDGGAADAWFNQPAAVAVDETGAVYVADFVNNRIRLITGGIVSTFAGDGNAANFWYPTGIAMNNHNVAYIADMNNHRIQLLINHNLVTFAGSTQGFVNGTGVAAKFSNPYGVALGADGTVYVADQMNHAIRKITATGVVTTLAGGTDGNADGTGTAAQFQLPRALAVDAQGNVFVADFYGQRIRMITPQGVVTTLNPLMADGSGPAHLGGPAGIAIDQQGNLYIADAGTHRIYKMIR